jgi:hypothetical protein
MRHRRLLLAADINRLIPVSMPAWALNTRAAVSTAGRTLMERPMKSGYPGVSTMLTRQPLCSKWQTAVSSVCFNSHVFGPFL